MQALERRDQLHNKACASAVHMRGRRVDDSELYRYGSRVDVCEWLLDKLRCRGRLSPDSDHDVRPVPHTLIYYSGPVEALAIRRRR